MPNCYWTRCTCPDQQPCQEHAGWHCGRWNNVVVSNLAQINDAITRDAERALVALDRDRDRVARIEDDLEQKRDELERERRQIEQMLAAARTMGERRAVARAAQAASDRLPQINQQLQDISADLTAITARITAVGGLISTYLIVPYTNPTGYCTCYDEKKNRLAALAGQRAQLVARLGPLLAHRGALMAAITPVFGAVANPNDLFRLFASIAFAAAIIVFILTGALAAAITFLVGILLLNILIISTLLSVAAIDKQIIAVRHKIVSLDLVSYRVQSITTCQQPPALPAVPPPPPPPPVIDENAWWNETTQPEPPPSEDE